MNSSVSIINLLKPLVENCEDATYLNLGIDSTEGGGKIIDAGINYDGCLESGRLITEICMGGLGRASLNMSSSDKEWPYQFRFTQIL